MTSRASADDIAVSADVGLPNGAAGWRVIGYGDFNGDGKTDLAWRRTNETGEVRIWLLDGSALLADLGLPNGAPGWHVVGVGDFDGDGKSDLVWRRTNETLEARIWFLDGGTLRADVGLPIGGPGWHIIGVGDFNGDRKSDLAWRRTNETGEVRLWLMSGSTLLADVGLPQGAGGWRVIGYGDFNGDGKTDLAWRRWDETGEVRVWLLNGATLLADLGLPYGAAGWRVVGIGDFDGDRKSDLVWRRTNETREARVWLLDGGTLRQDLGLPMGDEGWHVIGVGEFNGDNRSDLVWRRTDETGEVRLWFLKRVTDLGHLSLNVPLRGQQTSSWCWAASTEMVMTYLGSPVGQCTQANERFGRGDCCTLAMCSNPGAAHACARGGWPEFWRWGYSAKATAMGSAMSLGTLASEFAANRPVAFSWGWPGGSGHMMVAKGLYYSSYGIPMVEILDPWAPCVGHSDIISYDWYVQGANDHVHWVDFHQVRPDANAYWNSLGWGAVMGASASAPAGAFSPVTPAATPAADAGPLVHLDAWRARRGHPTPHAAAAAAVREVHAARPGRIPGLRDAGAAEAAAPGASVAQYMVRLDELSTFTAGGDPEKLLHDTGTVLVPMHVNGQVRSGVIAAKHEAGFTMVAMGREHLTKKVTERIAAAPRTATQGERFLVNVPALRREFIAWRELGSLTFLPLEDDLSLGFNRSKPIAAAEALARLVPQARSTDSSKPQ